MEQIPNELDKIGTAPVNFKPIPSNGKDYTLLGKDNSGFVELMQSTINNKYYAIKKIRKIDSLIQNFIKKTLIQMSLDNEYIVKLHGYFYGSEYIYKLRDIYQNEGLYQNINQHQEMIYLVFDLMLNQNLEYYNEIRKVQKNNWNQTFIITIFKQLLKALYYLHGRGFIHNNINLKNISFDENNNIKLTNSGFSIEALINL